MIQEIIKASKYYGRNSPGIVLLVDGQPWHFPNKRSIPKGKHEILIKKNQRKNDESQSSST